MQVSLLAGFFRISMLCEESKVQGLSLTICLLRLGPNSPVIRSPPRASPSTGGTASPVAMPNLGLPYSPRRSLTQGATGSSGMLMHSFSSSSSLVLNPGLHLVPGMSGTISRARSHSGAVSPHLPDPFSIASSRKSISDASVALAKEKSRSARKLNDSLVYLDGPQVYGCAKCRTHLTSHDEIISKCFHGRHGTFRIDKSLHLIPTSQSSFRNLVAFFEGRAYLFDNCVNVSIGRAEDRRLITGLHSVCDIFCKRCNTLVGWTYKWAYEPSQKYKEGKFIIEKINLHLEESDYFDVAPPAGERNDRFRARSISWGSETCSGQRSEAIYEYHPSTSF